MRKDPTIEVIRYDLCPVSRNTHYGIRKTHYGIRKTHYEIRNAAYVYLASGSLTLK